MDEVDNIQKPKRKPVSKEDKELLAQIAEARKSRISEADIDHISNQVLSRLNGKGYQPQKEIKIKEFHEEKKTKEIDPEPVIKEQELTDEEQEEEPPPKPSPFGRKNVNVQVAPYKPQDSEIGLSRGAISKQPGQRQPPQVKTKFGKKGGI